MYTEKYIQETSLIFDVCIMKNLTSCMPTHVDLDILRLIEDFDGLGQYF